MLLIQLFIIIFFILERIHIYGFYFIYTGEKPYLLIFIYLYWRKEKPYLFFFFYIYTGEKPPINIFFFINTGGETISMYFVWHRNESTYEHNLFYQLPIIYLFFYFRGFINLNNLLYC